MDAETERKTSAPTWRLGPERALTLDRPRLMAILNLTPDSFSDGGRFASTADAVAEALRLVDEGADVLDVGGESTRPGAPAVPAEEQIRRVEAVIRAVRAQSDVAITIDTTVAEAAQAALEAGADAINDISAGRDDAAMFALAAERACGLVLMHRRERPEADSFSDRYTDPPKYEDVVKDVRTFLAQRAEAARAAGLEAEHLVVDPGLGFGKSVAQNYELIARTRELAGLGYPVLSAASRKSFIGAVSRVEEPHQRLAGSIAVSVAHFLAGVRLFRVHDVRAHREALTVAEAITRGAVS